MNKIAFFSLAYLVEEFLCHEASLPATCALFPEGEKWEHEDEGGGGQHQTFPARLKHILFRLPC